MEKTVTEDFFIRYDIPVDCADVPYALRWIYARIAHLPAAATNEDGRLFGHWSTAWGHLPASQDWFRDQRFRRALLSMLEETSTKTIPADTRGNTGGMHRTSTLASGEAFVADLENNSDEING